MPAAAIQYLITMNATQARQAVASFSSYLSNTVANASRTVGNPFSGVVSGAGNARGAVAAVGGAFMNLQTIAAGAAGAMAKASVDAAAQAEAAFKGLESVANRSGVGIEKAWSAVLKLTEDGVMSQTEAATALKNLFNRGFGIEESVALIERFRDSAAFGRQAALGWGEAIVTATEGLKNENSVLVDNAGVTKNVAKMWEEYADKIGVATNDLTLAQKRQAEYEGVMKETTRQVGDTSKALEGLQGTNAKLAKSWTDLKTTLGSELTPAYQTFGNNVSWLIEKTSELVKLMTQAEKIGNPFRFLSDAFQAAGRGRDATSTAGLFSNLVKDRIAAASDGMKTTGRSVLGLPPVPAPSGVPPLSTNKTGIAVVGADGKPLRGPTNSTAVVRDNIDKAQIEKEAAERADAEAAAKAKQDYNKREKETARAKQAADDDLKIYVAGLNAQKAALDAQLSAQQISHAAHAKAVAALDLAEAEKTDEVRLKRAQELQKQLELAKQTGDKELIAGAEAALNSELKAGEENAQKLKALKIRAGQEVTEAAREDAEEQRRIQETLLQARVAAEKATGDAIRDRELAEVQALFDEKLITEEEYLRRSAALKAKALDADIARNKEQQEFLEKQRPTDQAQAAADKGKLQELQAAGKALAQQRVQLTNETESKVRLAHRQTAQLQRDLDAQLLEAQGKTFEARKQAIENWLKDQREMYAAYPDLLAKAESVAQAQHKQNAFSEAQDALSLTNLDYDRKQAELQRRSQSGLMTDIELDRESLALKKEQANALRERLELLKANADGSTSSVQAIAELEEQIKDLDASFSAVAQSVNDNFFGAIENGFQELLSGTERSFRDFLRKIASSVLSQMATMALRSGLQSLFGTASGGGLGGLFTSLLGGSGGGFGGFMTSLFGGAREAGGPVQAGKVYLVGEKGPELMYAGTSGQIFSNADTKNLLRGIQANTAMPRASSEYNPVSSSTNVNVAPRVVISAYEMLEAMAQLPAFENHVVQVAARNGNRIQKRW